MLLSDILKDFPESKYMKTTDSDFIETEHPRDNDGKFAEKSSGNSGAKTVKFKGMSRSDFNLSLKEKIKYKIEQNPEGEWVIFHRSTGKPASELGDHIFTTKRAAKRAIITTREDVPKAVKQAEAKAEKKEVLKTKVTELDLKSTAHDIIRDMRSGMRNARSYSGDLDIDEVGLTDSGSYVIDIRDWGEWEVPYGEEDDGDYDWKTLTEKSRVKLRGILDEYGKKYPDMEFRFSINEKNWLAIVVSPKQMKTHDALTQTEFQGIKITIENSKGSVRKGEDEEGNNWRTKMFYPYGFINKTEGTDGDEIDCFIGPVKDAKDAFIISNMQDGKYDEDKVMLGFGDELHARDAFLAHYDDSRHLGKVLRMSMEEFQKKVSSHKRGTRIQ